MSTQTRKTALVTGASRGLGFALGQELARQGWDLIIDGRDPGSLNAAYETLAAHTNKVIAIIGDITDPAHRQKLAHAAAAAGGLDAVINNASTLGLSPQPDLMSYPLDALENVFRVNVIGQLGILQAVYPYLKPGARLFNVTSDAAVEAYGGWGGYGASKAALEQLSAILAEENPSFGIYWVDPGDMRTEMQQAAFPGEDISDRPLPEASVPGFMSLLEGDWPSGRYLARELNGGAIR